MRILLQLVSNVNAVLITRSHSTRSSLLWCPRTAGSGLLVVVAALAVENVVVIRSVAGVVAVHCDGTLLYEFRMGQK